MQFPPAQQMAYEYLCTVVQECRATDCSRMPPHRQMCIEAGVSPVTLLRALRRLKDEGVVTARPGSGTHVVGATAPQAGTHPRPGGVRKTRWRRLAAEIHRGVLDGTFRSGNLLPPPKELARRYTASYRTLMKALDDLADRRVLRRANRRFHVPEPPGASHGSTVVLVAAGRPSGTLDVFSPRTRDYVGSLESECSRSRLNLVVSPFDASRVRGGHFGDAMDPKRAGTSPLGFVVFQHGLDKAPLTRLIEHLAVCRVPIAVLDEGIGYRMPPAYCRDHMVQVYSIAYRPSVGEQVGRYLLRFGHRRAAYISLYAERDWSRNRYQGLRSALNEVGGDATLFASTRPPPAPGRTALREMSPSLEAANLVERLQRIEATQDKVRALLRRDTMRPLLTPLLEQALSRREVTAWVTDNDDIALECLDFLGQKHIDVPGRISVVGFDNSMAALVRGLTSYSFNCAAASHALLRHILEPSFQRGMSGTYESMEIEGFVAHKSTVGHAVPTPTAGPGDFA